MVNTVPSPPLRLGFIGGSLTSAVGYVHVVASQLDGEWQLVAGCFSRDHQVNQQSAARWRIDPNYCFDNWQQMVNRVALDAVVVLTPTPSHTEIVCHLLEQGIAVICEKALAATIDDGELIAVTQQRTGTFLAVTYNYSGYPMVRELRQQIRSGALGQVHQIQCEMPADIFMRKQSTPQVWRLHDGEIPTLLLDLAVHLHHLCAFLTGAIPRRVNADFHHFGRFGEIVDDAYLWIHYRNQLRASMWVSKSALGQRNGLKIRLFGNDGAAKWYQEQPEQLYLYDSDSLCRILDRGHATAPTEFIERFKPGHPSGNSASRN